MHKPVPAAVPPLWIWACLALATLLITAGIYYQNRSTAKFSARSMDRYIDSAAAAAGPAPVILIIGTSLTEAGLAGSERIAQCVLSETAKRVIVLKSFKPNTDLASLVAEHDRLFRRVRPSVVMLEANMLFYRPLRQAALSRYMQTFRDLIGGRIWQPFRPDQLPDIAPTPRSAAAGFRAGLVDTGGLTLFRIICDNWRRQGCQVSLVNFPLEKELERQKWTSGDTATFYHNARFLSGTGGPFPFYDPHLLLDSTFFFDYCHFNRRGNDLFAPWYCGVLATEVKKWEMQNETAK